jgi:hypothetical protein
VVKKNAHGVGLALVAPVDDPMNVFRRNHRKIGEVLRCMTEVQAMFIRLVHMDNDSGAAYEVNRQEMMTVARLTVRSGRHSRSIDELRAL